MISIVGAGPGDPELLTVKALKRLQAADIVLYDALILPETLQLAPQARHLYVGKRAGRKSTRQDVIHRLLIRFARKGLHVVRLKGGDPFVLGRGGEEALALVEAGVAFEVIPGISSSISAPALSGIPVTHRGISSAFTVVAGHARSVYGPVLESIAPHSLTLVVLMGLGSRSEISKLLIARGWNPWTPAAVIHAASTPQQSRWIGTIADLAAPAESELPGTLVIGDVVSLAATLAPERETHVLNR